MVGLLYFPTSPTHLLLHYLGNRKPTIASFYWNAECCFANRHKSWQNTFILSLSCSWTAIHSHKNEPYAPNKTKEGSIACYRLLPFTHRFPSQSWCRSLCQKWELFLVEPHMKSQRTVLVGHFTISTNVSCYQTRCRRQYYLPFSNTAHACTSALVHVRNTVQQLLHKTLNLTSPELWSQQARAELS